MIRGGHHVWLWLFAAMLLMSSTAYSADEYVTHYGPVRTYAPLIGGKTVTSTFAVSPAPQSGEVVVINGNGDDLSPRSCSGMGLIQRLVCEVTNIAYQAIAAVERPVSVEITLNGVLIVRPAALPRTVNRLVVPVTLKASNQISLKIKGSVFSSVAIQVRSPKLSVIVTPPLAGVPRAVQFTASTSSSFVAYRFQARLLQPVTIATVTKSKLVSASATTTEILDTGWQTSPIGELVFVTAGNYEVTVSAKDVAGNVTSTTTSVNIVGAANMLPIAQITYEGLPDSAPASVRFNGLISYDPDGTIQAYHWIFSDGGDSFLPLPIHLYSTPGTYTATLRVQDDAGAWSDPVSVNVRILENQPPVAIANYTDTEISRYQKLLRGTSSFDAEGPIARWEWSLRNSGEIIGREADVNYTFPGSGTFALRLTVYDQKGANGFMDLDLVIQPNQPPVPRFVSEVVDSEDREVALDASNSTDDGVIQTYVWNFPDGSTASGRRVQHSFSNGGFATVRLTIIDDDGISRSVSRSISIQNLPVTQHEVMRCQAR